METIIRVGFMLWMLWSLILAWWCLAVLIQALIDRFRRKPEPPPLRPLPGRQAIPSVYPRSWTNHSKPDPMREWLEEQDMRANQHVAEENLLLFDDALREISRRKPPSRDNIRLVK